MSARSDNLRNSAARLIRTNGKLISYVVVTPGTYNTATSRATVAKTTTDIKAVLSRVTKAYDAKDGYQLGDLRVTVAALDVAAPTLGDRLMIDTEEWAVVGVNPVYFESDAVTYKIHARRT